MGFSMQSLVPVPIATVYSTYLGRVAKSLLGTPCRPLSMHDVPV